MELLSYMKLLSRDKCFFFVTNWVEKWTSRGCWGWTLWKSKTCIHSFIICCTGIDSFFFPSFFNTLILIVDVKKSNFLIYASEFKNELCEPFSYAAYSFITFSYEFYGITASLFWNFYFWFDEQFQSYVSIIKNQ